MNFVGKTALRWRYLRVTQRMPHPRITPFHRLVTLSITLAWVSLAHAETSTTYKLADGFDYPVGPPDASGYYKARGFYPNGHLGEDWNGKGGGNTDEGDPIYNIGDGVVVYSDDFEKGWGNVIIVRHAYREKDGRIHYIDSLYGHLKVREAFLGDRVLRGQRIGTMGCGPNRMYWAHLHFEIRKNLAIGMNRSTYTRGYENYHSPTHFIRNNRQLRKEFRMVRIPIDTFLQSNPNRFVSRDVEIPKSPTFSVASARPKVPEDVLAVMEQESGGEPADTPGKLSDFWVRFKALLNQ
ncbi:MAG: M23 family metallopeptidase [Verrucomicrobiota bacterium]